MIKASSYPLKMTFFESLSPSIEFLKSVESAEIDSFIIHQTDSFIMKRKEKKNDTGNEPKTLFDFKQIYFLLLIYIGSIHV